jgi:hypothetical protein
VTLFSLLTVDLAHYPLPIQLNSAGILFVVSAPKNKPAHLLKDLAQKVKKGESVCWKVMERIGLVVFKSSKQFNLFSNVLKMTTKVTVKNLKGQNVTKPECVDLYAKNMNAVDKADIRLHKYFPQFQFPNWKFCTFIGYLFMSLSNASCYTDGLNGRFAGSTGNEKRTPFRNHLVQLIDCWIGEKKEAKFNFSEHKEALEYKLEEHDTFDGTSTSRYLCRKCSEIVGEDVYMKQKTQLPDEIRLRNQTKKKSSKNSKR